MNTLIDQAVAKGIISFDADIKNVTYVFQNKKRSYTNPEEKIQTQTFCKLVLQYGYSEKLIKQFVTVKMGVSDKEADMIVYEDEAHTKPYIIVECKHEDISELEFQEAVKQAYSYAHALASTVRYIWVTKGNKEEFYLFDKNSQAKYTDTDIPYFGQKDTLPFKYVKGGGTYQGKKVEDIAQIDENALTRIFKQAHDVLWAGGELNPSQAFDELDKLIFCKIWDEKNTLKNEPYEFQIRKKEAQENLQKRILQLYDKGKVQDPEVFNKPIDLPPYKIKAVVEYLQKVNLSETDLDSKGKAFETFIGHSFRGEFGQFFTPRNVVKFAVDVLPITHESKVLDTSCGSGGFLLYVLDKVRKQADARYDLDNPKEAVAYYKHWHDFAERRLFGIEINEQIARTAKMNMIIHDDGHTNVVQFDGLFEIDYLRKNCNGGKGNNGFEANTFDFVVTNPPFGSIAKQSEKSYMQTDEGTALYYDFSLKELNWIEKSLKPQHKTISRENQATEILFIEQCYHFLKEGGYMAIVLPDGVLTNSSAQYVRDGIEEKFRIVAVVSLPQTAFAHTGAGVKSSVLFLKKWNFAKTKEIKNKKDNLATHIATTRGLRAHIEAWEAKKKDLQKQLKKKSPLNLEGGSLAEQITDINEQIQTFKEELEEVYQAEKSKLLAYPIFMAIAEQIGLDATGKKINQNDLEDIALELQKFLQAIENEQDSFFG